MKFKPKITEGEEFIRDYLDRHQIKYEEQKEIHGLKNDTKKHRIADFWLPEYKVYIEFFGRWNRDANSRQDYEFKKKVYAWNGIPCLYIYPDNLGILDYRIEKQMRLACQKSGLHKELMIYLLSRVFMKNYVVFALACAFGYLLYQGIQSHDIPTMIIFGVLSGIFGLGYIWHYLGIIWDYWKCSKSQPITKIIIGFFRGLYSSMGRLFFVPI